MREWWRRVRPRVVSKPIVWIARLIGCTLRIRAEGYEELDRLERGAIFCGWHGRSFLAALRFRKKGYWVIISQSRDGDIQNVVFRSLGFHTIRGSTGRDGARAAVESIRVLREGGKMAITPDGPRGPTHEVQGGVMVMAQKSGAALIPTGPAAHPRCLAKSWDRYMIPMPFARSEIVFGEPIYVPSGASAEEVEAIRLRLQEAMNEVEAESERRVGARKLSS